MPDGKAVSEVSCLCGEVCPAAVHVHGADWTCPSCGTVWTVVCELVPIERLICGLLGRRVA